MKRRRPLCASVTLAVCLVLLATSTVLCNALAPQQQLAQQKQPSQPAHDDHDDGSRWHSWLSAGAQQLAARAAVAANDLGARAAAVAVSAKQASARAATAAANAYREHAAPHVHAAARAAAPHLQRAGAAVATAARAATDTAVAVGRDVVQGVRDALHPPHTPSTTHVTGAGTTTTATAPSPRPEPSPSPSPYRRRTADEHDGETRFERDRREARQQLRRDGHAARHHNGGPHAGSGSTASGVVARHVRRGASAVGAALAHAWHTVLRPQLVRYTGAVRRAFAAAWTRVRQWVLRLVPGGWLRLGQCAWPRDPFRCGPRDRDARDDDDDDDDDEESLRAFRFGARRDHVTTHVTVDGVAYTETVESGDVFRALCRVLCRADGHDDDGANGVARPSECQLCPDSDRG